MQYVLGQDVVGTVVASDPQIGVNLYRVDGPLVVAVTRVRGLYPNDTWSGPRVTYERTHCAGGTLSVQLGSDATLFRSVQTVTAFVGLRPVARAQIAPAGCRDASRSAPLARRRLHGAVRRRPYGCARRRATHACSAPTSSPSTTTP